MKKFLYLLWIVAIISACSNDFLDTENLREKDLDSYYASPKDLDEALAGVYNALYMPDILSMEGVAANLLSDMMLGGGGPDDVKAKAIDAFQDPLEDTYFDLWGKTYQGVTRANALIEKGSEADLTANFTSDAEAQAFKRNILGEAHFMRAFFYFRAAKFFGGMPLITKINDDRTVGRATFSETFAQIASDLKKAIEMMPSETFTNIPTSQYGHANKWVAQAYLARVYLFYTGYMTNIEGQATSELPLVEGGGISKAEVLNNLEDCIANSGYKLADDFRELWPYANVNSSAGEVVLPWADDEDLEWVGQDGHTPTFGTGNLETMFMVRYSFGDWGYGQQFSNRIPLFFGVRGNNMVPFGTGWGWGPVNPNLWHQWDDTDPRKRGSILELGEAAQGTQSYQGSQGDHETGYTNKKYTTVQHGGSLGVVGMFVYMYNWPNTDFQLWAAQDYQLIRFADVLLMHSEISETPNGLNQVRARAGLSSVGYSLEALKEERLHELSFEGLRWFDIVRWGDVDTAFNGTIPVNNSGIAGTYSITYRSETKGLLPIPETEIRLSGGLYQQNPGW